MRGGLPETIARSPFISVTTAAVRYAGIGGLSEVLGWTEVQEAEGVQKLGGPQVRIREPHQEILAMFDWGLDG